MKYGDEKKMLPIGPLMIEHRLIERIIGPMVREIERIERTAKVDAIFIETAVDFFRTYADRCHHGKEEDILFRELARKTLSQEHKRIMDELVSEHAFGRKTVRALLEARQRYEEGHTEALNEIIKLLQTLIEFYPAHIEKEDKHFFLPVMAYLGKEEKDEMLAECFEFDRRMIHEKYEGVIEKLERTPGKPQISAT
jgi:hemerythrin-like domain-containing protein